MGSKSPSTSTSQTTSANPTAATDVTAALNRARQASKTPYQAYTGQLTAGVNSQETGAINATNDLSSATNGYLGQAAGLAGASTAAVNPTAINGSTIAQYESPYQSDVVNATMAEIANQNKQQSEAQTSSAISAGAFGGDRAGVAQAALAGQQDLASNATLANLNNENYSQALGEANTQQQTTLSADQANRAALQSGSQIYSNLGDLASSTGIANANAQLQGGLLEQQTQQASDTAQYGQFENQQAYPFQTAEFLGGLTSSLAPELGTSSTGTTVSSPANPLNSILGAGLGLGSFFLPKADGGACLADVPQLARGGSASQQGTLTLGDAGLFGNNSEGLGAVHRYARGGRTLGDALDYEGLGGVQRFADGGMAGMPYSDATGYVPTVSLSPGRAPSPGLSMSQPSQQPTTDPSMANLTTGLGMAGKNFMNSNAGDSVSDFAQDNLGLATGGKVVDLGSARRVKRGYDDGGVVPPDTNSLLFDPNALGTLASAGSIQPGLGAAALPSTMSPPSQGLGAASLPSSQSQGLGAAANLPSAGPTGSLGNPPPVPVAPAGTLTPSAPNLASPASQGLGGADPSATGGLGAINRAAPPSGQVGSGFDSNVNRTLQFEGGYNPSDANGSPSNFGINQAAHPDIDVSKLTPDQAKSIYKSQYWDAIGADNLPPALAHVAFDTAVVAGPAKAKELIAQSGGDASKFMDLRDGYLNGLVATDPQKYGAYAKQWADRDAALRSDISGGMPSGAMSYVGGASGTGNNGGGLGAAGPQAAPSLGDAASLPEAGLAAVRNAGSGLLGAIMPSGMHFSDNERLGVLAAGLGMMASPSRSVGQAIGQGGLAGIQQYQGLQKLSADQANIKSEIANRAGLLGIEGRKQNLAEIQAKRIWDAADAISKEFKANGSAGGGTSLTPTAPSPVQPLPSPAPQASGVSPPATSQAASTASPAAPSFDWSKVAPDSNPAVLDAKAATYERASMAAVQSPEQAAMYSKMALQYRSSAAQIRQSGKLTMTDGSTVLAPGYANAEASIERAKADAQASTEAGYRVREQEPTPGGPTTYTTDAQIVKGMNGGVGAGSPPGSAAGQPPAVVAKQPAFYAAKQDMIAKNEGEMVEKFQARQVARQRLQDLQSILQNYKTGAFSEEKADIAAKLSAAGIPVSKENLESTANFQKFTKDATANLFDNVKTMGGRVLVSEIEGLKNANANADLQPAANAAIIGQGIGLLNYEDKHAVDYFSWKNANPNATDTSAFELPWAKANPVAPFVNEARLGTAAKGIAIPAAADRVQGQAYMTPRGKAVWTGTGWRLAQ